MNFAMNFVTLQILALLAAQPSTSALPTLDQVLARYAEARGGRVAWAAVQGMAIAGTFTAFSLEEPVHLWRARPNLYRFATTVRAQPLVLGHDGKAPWWIHGAYGVEWAQPATGPDYGLIQREAHFAPLLLESGDARLELLGAGEVDGQPTLKVQVTLAAGAVEIWHLDPQTGLEVAIDATTWDLTQREGAIAERTYFSDFRPVGALVLPFRIEKEYGVRNTVLAIHTVELNPQLDPHHFRRPLEPELLALADLVGEWQVEVQTPQAPDQPWASSNTTATIHAQFDGALLHEQLSLPRDGAQIEVVRQLGWDRFQGVYRLFQFDTLSSYPAVYAGKLAEGRLQLDNVATQTPIKSAGTDVFERMSWSDLNPAGFRLEIETSRDHGVTWEPTLRLIYTRNPNPARSP